MVERVCEHCGIHYITRPAARKRFCSLKCYGLSQRQRSERSCATCGAWFTIRPSEDDRIYCSHSCHISARNRTALNPAYHRDISGTNNPMHGKGLRGAANPMFGRTKERAPRWKGGRRVRPDGYAYVLVPDDHPHPAYAKRSGAKYMLEHRRIMELSLGRFLDPAEVVHHRDGNPRNNDISNLELFASHSEHVSHAHSEQTQRLPRRRRTAA